jgi:BioD-like phosphotransacetylase family protein
MVYAIYVSGSGFSGKTALSLGLLSKFKEIGLDVGYFKPVGQGHKMVDGKIRDQDAILMKEVLGLKESLDDLCPVVLGIRYLNQVKDKCDEMRASILEAFNRVKAGKELLIVESSTRPELLTSCGLDVPALAKELDAKIIFSVKGEHDIIADSVILYRDYARWKGAEMMGAVLNFVPYQQLERMKSVVAPILENCDISILGIVPDQRELTQPFVHDLVDVLGAEVLAGKGNLNNQVDGFLVGAMSPESAMSWLRRSIGGALITGGDRTDLIVTALETKPSAIILTGNIYPSVQVLSSADEKRIPILLVSSDTYTTVTRLDLLEERMVSSPSSSKKIQLTRQIINDHVDWRLILEDYNRWKNGIV